MKSERSPVLTICHLEAGYGKTPVIQDLSLPPIKSGFVALVGPNGAGKSTLLRAMSHLVAAKGDIRLGDHDLLKMKPSVRASTIGFMPQSMADTITLTVLEAVIATLKVGGVDLGLQRIEMRALAVLGNLGIADLSSKPLNRLSGGQRQMVSLAQAIASEPVLLLLDEPTSALDVARQFLMMRMVKDYAYAGRIVVAVLHDLALAAQWADQIVVMTGGRLHSAGTPAEIITPQMLAEVYHIEARVERCQQGQIRIMVDGVMPSVMPTYQSNLLKK